jgi:hypothetical protein
VQHCSVERKGAVKVPLKAATKAVVLETRSSPLCGVIGSGDRLVGSQAFRRMKLSASRNEPARTSTVVG